MNADNQWRTFWKQKTEQSGSDYEYDHGRSPRQKVIEDLSNQELLSFIKPSPSEVIFDAGCGTGANILLLHSNVRHVSAMDYNQGAVERCRTKMHENGILNVEVMQGSITEIPLPSSSVDKTICLSVLHYLSNDEVRSAFGEFKRILKPGGVAVLHVKNLSSVYLSSLWMLKKAKSLFRSDIKLEYYRSFRWYVNELALSGFEVIDYNSFNWLMLEGMPKRVLSLLQKFEFEHYRDPFFRSKFIRCHGSDLKIKAQNLK